MGCPFSFATKSSKDFELNSFEEFSSSATANGFLIAKDDELTCIFDDLKSTAPNFSEKWIEPDETLYVPFFAPYDSALLNSLAREDVTQEVVRVERRVSV